MKFLKEKKGIIISFIIGVIIASSITVYATSYLASQVTYKEGKTVEQALNELYANTEKNVLCSKGQFTTTGGTDTIEVKFQPSNVFIYGYNGNVYNEVRYSRR